MSETEPPLITVVSGNPTDEEIAALTVVLTAAASAASPAPRPGVPDNWGAHTRMHRTSNPFSPYSYTSPPVSPPSR